MNFFICITFHMIRSGSLFKGVAPAYQHEGRNTTFYKNQVPALGRAVELFEQREFIEQRPLAVYPLVLYQVLTHT